MKNNTILVTGASGFIGSKLVGRLRDLDYDVHELIRYVGGGRFDYWERKNRVFADLRDRESVLKAVEDVKPEIVVNLGAITPVSFSFTDPVAVFETNAVGTINLADACLRNKVKLLIHASTSEVYGRAKSFPTKEDDDFYPTSPYAIAKIAAERYLHLLKEIYDAPITIVRPFNTYGRAFVRNSHYVVERAIVSALKDGMIDLHNPKPMRDFLFRDDHVDGYVRIIVKNLVGEVVNICPDKDYTIYEMANTVAKIVEEQTGKQVSVSFKQTPDRPLDIFRLHGDNSKARILLGWTPHYSLEAGLRKAIMEWQEVLKC